MEEGGGDEDIVRPAATVAAELPDVTEIWEDDETNEEEEGEGETAGETEALLVTDDDAVAEES